MCSGKTMRVLKEYKALQKNYLKTFNYQVFAIELSDCMQELTFTLEPSEGTWKNGRFKFKAHLEGYPSSVRVSCLSDIRHPNIEDFGGICLNLIDDWNTDLTLADLIQGILFLFYEPNFEDPLTSYFECGSEEPAEDFMKNNIDERFYENEARVDLVQNIVKSAFSVIYQEPTCNHFQIALEC